MLKKKFRKSGLQKFDRIAFFGPIASGKTYAADYLVGIHGFRQIGFANKIKAISYELFGTNGKDGHNRVIYHKVGHAMREIQDNVWIDYLERTIEKWEDAKLVVDDLRFVNEAKMLKRHGFVLIQVVTPPSVRAERIVRLYPSMPEDAHNDVSEQEWSKIWPDYEISGETWNGLLQLDTILESPW